MKIVNSFILLILFFTFYACSRCKKVLLPPDYFEIAFVDSAGNYVLGTIDSLRLYNDTFEKYIKPTPFADPRYVQISFAHIQNFTSYYIDLNESDTDTLSFHYSTIENKCFTGHYLEDIVFNGQHLSAEQPIHLVK